MGRVGSPSSRTIFDNVDNPYKPLMPLVGRRFGAENWGWLLPADAVSLA